MDSMNSDLIALCQMFLVPATILFAALGISMSEGLKTMVSLLGALLGCLWTIRVLFWTSLSNADYFTGLSLASLFAAAALVSLWVHGRIFWTGKTPRKTIL
jgi:hypothetical protein